MDAVAGALSDPIRRSILQMLRAQPATAGVIAAAFDVSRPAVSRHLRVLREADLVRDEAHGREREYRLNLEALQELERFLGDLRAGEKWHRRFDALATEVRRVRKRRETSPVAKNDTEKRKKETA